LVRRLGVEEGGLLIKSAMDIREAAWAASWFNSMKAVFTTHGDLMNQLKPTMLTNNHILFLAKPEIKITLEDNAITTVGELTDYLARDIPLQRSFMVPYAAAVKAALKANIEGERAVMAYYLSNCSRESSLWITSSRFIRNAATTMTSIDFAINLRLQLLLPILRANDNNGVRCVCGPNLVELPNGAYHAFSCGAGLDAVNRGRDGIGEFFRGPAGIITNRHNRIRDALADYLRVACPADHVFMERWLPDVANRLKSDVAVSVGNEICHIDVVVTNPASKACLESRTPDVVKLTAATQAEGMKVAKYRRSYNERNGLKRVADNMVPFALEVTWTLRKKALEFVDTLAKIKDVMHQNNPHLAWARRFFLNRVSVICAKIRAMMVMVSQAVVKYDEYRIQRAGNASVRFGEGEEERYMLYDYQGEFIFEQNHVEAVPQSE
jgi:hypothetical protein